LAQATRLKCGKALHLRVVQMSTEPSIETQISSESLLFPLWSWSQEQIRGLKRRSWSKLFSTASNDHDGKFRLLDRAGSFGQSAGQWQMCRVSSEGAREARALYSYDLYHTFMDGGSIWLHILLYIVLYTAVFTLSAIAYLKLSDSCGLGLDGSFARAYYLSVETITTIGYGVPDQYFNDCPEGTVLLTVQSLAQFFLHALVLGSVFSRVTRPQARARTILFSEKAIVRELEGAAHFIFQVGEVHRQEIIEAHIRCYCVRHFGCGRQSCEALPMRLQHPDDDMGAMLFPAIPSQVVHRIDSCSPLSPNWEDRLSQSNGAEREDGDTSVQGSSARPFLRYKWPEVPYRQVDAEQGNRDGYFCEVCGSSFATLEMLRLHARYLEAQDEQNGVPPEHCHRGWVEHSAKDLSPPLSAGVICPTLREVRDFVSHQYMEVLVLIEGIEPITSCTVQARHSYIVPDDVAWGKEFKECVSCNGDMPCMVDFGRFHLVRSARSPNPSPLGVIGEECAEEDDQSSLPSTPCRR